MQIYTDGGSRGNPGKAGAGAVIYKDGKKIKELYKPLGVQTNNFAEYEAVKIALQYLLEHGLQNEPIEVLADSKLVVEQLSGNWKVKNENVRRQFNEVVKLLAKFPQVFFTHIPREKNKEADALANKAMDL